MSHFYHFKLKTVTYVHVLLFKYFCYYKCDKCWFSDSNKSIFFLFYPPYSLGITYVKSVSYLIPFILYNILPFVHITLRLCSKWNIKMIISLKMYLIFLPYSSSFLIFFLSFPILYVNSFTIFANSYSIPGVSKNLL